MAGRCPTLSQRHGERVVVEHEHMLAAFGGYGSELELMGKCERRDRRPAAFEAKGPEGIMKHEGINF